MKQTNELNPGMLYDGVVTRYHRDTKTYVVRISQTGQLLPGVVRGGDIMAGLLGFKTTADLTKGTKVKVSPGDHPVIVTCVGSDLPDGHAGGSRTTTGFRAVASLQASLKDPVDRSLQVHSPPADLLEGEFEISNLLGVALTMLTNLAKLSAGDRAAVEVHLLNDMVRIVSETFRHFSALGNEEIYNDGRLNARRHATSYESESFGKKAADKGKKLIGSNNEVDLSSIDAVNDTGRWRYDEYVGFLGDFIHQFVSDPTDALANIATAGLRSGKARFHINMDGTILLQSVAEIALERVVRVLVPVEKKRWDDPAGTTQPEFDSLPPAPLKMWNYGEGLKDLPAAAYQLREYARWLSNLHCLARFRQLDKNWVVPLETELPVPEWTNKEPDREAANGSLSPRYRDAYATIRIMRDGSIVLWGTAGESVVLCDGNVQVTATKHLELQAAGDVRITAGRNILCKARRSVEIAAVVGGIQLKARTWLQALCEYGSIWLKSDATATPPAPANAEDPAAEMLGHAVLLEGTALGVMVSGPSVLVQAYGVPSVSNSDPDFGKVVVQSLSSGTDLRAAQNVALYSKGGAVSVKASKGFLVSAGSALWDLSTKLFAIRDALTLRGPTLSVNDIKANVLSATSSIMGPEIERGGASPHVNHINKLPPGDKRETQHPSVGELNAVGELTAAEETFVRAFPSVAPTWNFLEQDVVTPPYESLSQQSLRLDLTDAQEELYGAWTWEEDKLKTAPRTGSTFPMASTKNKELQLPSSTGKNLREASNAIPTASAAKPLEKPTSFKFLKK